MKDRLSNPVLILLLLLPLLAVNSGWREVGDIVERWKVQELERFASQKLGEIAANVDLSQHLAEYCKRFGQGMVSLLDEYPKRRLSGLPFQELVRNNFASPYPVYELWAFTGQPKQDEVEVAYCSEKGVSRRPMEMVFSALVMESREISRSQDEDRRNGKLLQKIFGNGCSIPLLAGDQRGIATPVIYRRVPSFLIWNYLFSSDGTMAGYFMIVPRNQDLDACALAMTARKTGLGTEVVGGFVKIFTAGSPDQYYPARLADSKVFMDWRNNLGVANEKLREWETNGFPWGLSLGRHRLYTRILTDERHLAILILPAGQSGQKPQWLQLINYGVSIIVLMLFLRGMLLGVWPFSKINGRFAVVFILAATLPAVLFITSATAYVYERYRAEESHLEETLVTSLSDFDAGKDLLENEYKSVYAAMRSDAEILKTLEDKGLDGSDAVFARLRQITDNRAGKISISGMALFDLGGNLVTSCRENIRKADFDTLAKFYGLPFTLNLRQAATRDEPQLKLPEHKIDQTNVVALQSFKRGDTQTEFELERYRNRVIRTDYGRGFLGYIYDYLTIKGRNRYVLMVAWLESDIDREVITRSAGLLGVKAPQIKLAAFRRTANGEEALIKPDRAFSAEQLRACRKVSASAFSIKSGVLRASTAGMSVVAYASRRFDRTVLIGAIDHAQKDMENRWRIGIFVLLGLLAGIFLVASVLSVWLRIIGPLKAIKSAFDNVEGGGFGKLPITSRADEIGLLNQEFNKMIEGLEERHRLASMLSEHAVASVASVSQDGKTLPEKFNAVVMVSDIRSFTTMCEEQPVEQVTALLNTHITEMATVINSFGGKIYKFIGDAIEAVFVDDYHFHQTPGLRAVQAGNAMLQRLQEINSRRLNSGLFAYRIGIGLAAGELVAGEVGSRFSRRDYAMFGAAFKRAEEFEALTKHFPDWPLIADHHVVHAAEKNDFAWRETKHGGEYVFNLIQPAVAEVKLQAPVEQTSTVSEEKNPPASVSEMSVSTRREISLPWRNLAFLAGLLCVLFPAAAFLFSSWTAGETRKLQAEKNAAAFCENIFTKLGIPESGQVMLEQFLDEQSEAMSVFPWNPDGISDSQLQTAADAMKVRLRSIGLQPEIAGILHKPGGASMTLPDDTWRLVHFQGRASEYPIVEEFLRIMAAKYYNRAFPEEKEAVREAGKLFGASIDSRYFIDEGYAHIVAIKRDGREGFLYWQPLLLRNPELLAKARADFSGPMLRANPSDHDILQIGGLICLIFSDELKKCSMSILKQFLGSEKAIFAITGNGSAPFVSAGFPVAAEKLAQVTENVLPGWLIRKTGIKVSGQDYQLWIAVETWSGSNIYYPVALLLVIVFSSLWYRSVYSETLVARSFASQLWLGLFAAAVVPITCVYTINEWYATEQRDMKLQEQRVQMIALFEQLERRQFMQEIVEWDKMHAISDSEEFLRMTSAVEKPDAEHLREFSNYVRDTAKVRHQYTGPTSFVEMVVFSSYGWQHAVYPTEAVGDVGDFKKFINVFLVNLFVDLGVDRRASAADDKPDGEAVKNEMTRDAGLALFRSLFGIDAYFKFVHGLNMPMRLLYASGVGCMKMIPKPGLINPDRIVLWLFFDTLNSAVRRILKKVSNPYPLYAEAKTSYGAFKQPWTGGWDPDVSRYVRWPVALKAPVSTRGRFAGRDCLIEARIGSHNENMIMIGMAPENDILASVEGFRKQLLLLILVSLLAIAALTFLVTADISDPVWQLIAGVKNMSGRRFDYRIQTGRRDELGQMMQAFNGMARGLQERELMGEMVSRAARRVAGDEESLRLAEAGQHLQVTVMYLAVPGFSSLYDSVPADELLAKISSQIDVLCGIIMNNDGEADKIIGEKILAYFYSPAGTGESNRMAMQALRLIDDAARDGLLPFPVCAGIHTGDIIAGLLGISSKRDFTIIGDTVNTAARINAKAAELTDRRYLASEAGVALTGCLSEPHGSVQLKGKTESVNLLRLRF